MIIPSVFLIPVNAEDGCNSYPQPGFEIKRGEDGKEKFIATSEVEVPIDDRSLYLDAKEEAEIAAKLQITKFINEEISGSTDIDKDSTKEIRVEGKTKSLNSRIVTRKLTKLRSQTPSTLIRGARVLGSCYTPGEALRVSVGWKLEDLDSAEKLGNTMNRKNPNNVYDSKNGKSRGASGENNKSKF